MPRIDIREPSLPRVHAPLPFSFSPASVRERPRVPHSYKLYIINNNMDEYLNPSSAVVVGYQVLNNCPAVVGFSSVMAAENRLILNVTGGISDDEEVNGTSTSLLSSSSQEMQRLKYYSYGIALPAICVLGIIGNVLNLIVLTRPTMKGPAYVYMRGTFHKTKNP